jgi:uncharacterized MAPEG superfamily protein
MLSPLASLVGFAAWAVVLVTLIGLVRVIQVMTGKKRPNEFPGGVPHGGDAYWRLNRAHLNAVENLPIFGALVLAGVALHVDSTLFRVLPQVVLAARVGQSLAHISSGRSLVVNVRFTFFLTQVTCFALLAYEVLRRAL